MTARAGDGLLMPCPFCGGEAAVEEEVPGGFVARCSDCAAQTAIYEGAERAQAAWDRRIADDCPRSEAEVRR